MSEKFFLSPVLIPDSHTDGLYGRLNKVGCNQAGRLLENSNWEEGQGGKLLQCQQGGACIAHRYSDPPEKFDKGLSNPCPAGLNQAEVVGTVFEVNPQKICDLLQS